MWSSPEFVRRRCTGGVGGDRQPGRRRRRGIGETAPAHDDGRLRVLAVFTDEPTPALADVPTAESLGLDVVIGSWAVIAAPAGLPDNVADRLEESIEKAAAAKEYTDLIESGGNIPLYPVGR